MVYTSAAYQEGSFLTWLEQIPYFALPWENVNAEHVAVIFTNSKQMIEWGQFDQIDGASTVATVCLFEEDQSIVPHAGYYDCFAERNTVQESLALLDAQQASSFGKDIDFWFTRVRYCADVEIPEERSLEIESVSLCRGTAANYPRDVLRFVEIYGEDSEQLAFVRAEAASAGLTAAPAIQ
jgi:hypothetical protein